MVPARRRLCVSRLWGNAQMGRTPTSKCATTAVYPACPGAPELGGSRSHPRTKERVQCGIKLGANASLLLGTQSREGRTVLCGRPRRAGCELRPSPLAEPEGPVSWLLAAPRKAAAVSNLNTHRNQRPKRQNAKHAARLAYLRAL